MASRALRKLEEDRRKRQEEQDDEDEDDDESSSEDDAPARGTSLALHVKNFEHAYLVVRRS